MKKAGIFCLILGIFLAITLVSASSYSIEFNQIGNSILVKETMNGKIASNYTDNSLLEKASSQLYFVKRVKFNESFNEAQIRLNLEKGVIVKDELVFPSDYVIESNGEIISITWNLKNITIGQDFAMFVTLEDTKTHSNVSYWIFGIVFIIIILGVILLIYQKSRKKEKSKITRVRQKNKTKKSNKEDYDYLLDTEKRVIEELKKANRNELWQKQIQNITGYSKAKVSRLVRNLESRNLITKIPFGNTNKIRLK